ncbi:hypothetical protein [Methylovulum psychrotolerans]|uniref:Uncharacterized protein n=1 Tax=Methylovulum psychrotolerans TaxID=1704499 RepID=A0A1Z4C0H7_9GAMM|nr:hypothetical protein [Methylovulum psychrotolerans]ASF47023.1 hypothetical protein CEK71_13600 [Methylovulum psychrotolerans]
MSASTPKYIIELYELPAPVTGEKQVGYRIIGNFTASSLVTKTDYLICSLAETLKHIGIKHDSMIIEETHENH